MAELKMCEKCGVNPRISNQRKRCEDCDPWCRQCEVNVRNNGSNYCYPCQATRRREWYANDPDNRAKRLASNKAGNDALRAETIAAYGGMCTCCHEDEAAFLTVDHVNNDGADHRKEIGRFGGMTFYRHLRSLGFPQDEYQLLCWNCNLAKHIYGICPHQC